MNTKTAVEKNENATASDEYGVATAHGRYGVATANGNSGVATAHGGYGVATANGYCGAATANGNSGVAVASGRNGKARGAHGCALFLVYRRSNQQLVHAKAVIVGVDGIKANTWYCVDERGEVVEAEE